jgi:pyruvate dehydrogenase E1 component
VIAASDYARALPELIRAFVPARYVTLGTDGFGRSDTRQALRAFFEVDRASIVVAALHALAGQGSVDRAVVRAARERYGKDERRAPSWQA